MFYHFFLLSLTFLTPSLAQTCRFSQELPGKYLSGYTSDGGKRYTTLEDAQAACCDIGMGGCGGVTFVPQESAWETRNGTQPKNSAAGEISYAQLTNLSPMLWPLPSDYDISPGLDLNVNPSGFTCKASVSSSILSNACTRYLDLIFPRTPENTNVDNGFATVTGLLLSVSDGSEDTLGFGMDESYNLTISSNGGTAEIASKTVWGALRGLETFSQLVVYNFTLGNYQSFTSTVGDAPRYSHRGILIDSSRHFLPLPVIYRQLDTMSYNKMNVLHWHIVDSQSFPVEIKSAPNLWWASWTPMERYSYNDVKAVVEYAKNLGIRVIPEFDMPGHAQSWCAGYPDLCPSPECNTPLNPASDTTWEVVTNVIKESSELFPDGFMHLGGDEVDTTCWTETPSIVQWMDANNYTALDALEYFDETAVSIAVGYGKTVIDWDEVFDAFGASKLDPTTTVIEWWRGWETDLLNEILSAGFRCIFAPGYADNSWYLDNIDMTWDQRYVVEPTDGVPAANQGLIIGGEACMWGETVDESDFVQTIWPEAAAVAERLWSPKSVNNVEEAKSRFAYNRCRMNQRGVGAAPAFNPGQREAPNGPNSCYWQ